MVSRRKESVCLFEFFDIYRVGFEKSKLYLSSDPAPPFPPNQYTTKQIREIYLDQSKSLFERYRAMFSLRDKGDKESIEALVAGLHDPKSALFRHEVAFVLGQIQSPLSSEALAKVLF